MAAATGRTKSWYLRRAMIEKIKGLEVICPAERVRERIAGGGTKTYPPADGAREVYR